MIQSAISLATPEIDRTWPRGRPTLKRLEQYLWGRGACNGAVLALRRAWDEHCSSERGAAGVTRKTRSHSRFRRAPDALSDAGAWGIGSGSPFDSAQSP